MLRPISRLACTLLCVLGLLGPAADALAQPSLYSTPTSMYATPKANELGDVVTVILAERTSAQRESGWQNSSNARRGGGGTVSGKSFSGTFGMDANFNRAAQNSNESVQRDLLSGTITVLVVGVDSLSGNLLVEGKRKLEVNGESHLLKVEGQVRPYDIRYDNTVYSYQIANADIEYRQGGLRRRFFKPATLTRVMAFLVLAGSAAVAVI